MEGTRHKVREGSRQDMLEYLVNPYLISVLGQYSTGLIS